MKKFYLAILAVVAFVFASCSKDEVKLDNNNSLSFNFTVEGTPSLNDGTKAVKKAWENGDCVFIIFNDETITGALKYMKLTYNSSTTNWTASLEGAGSAKLTKEEIKAYCDGTATPQVYGCYFQGVSELETINVAGNNRLTVCKEDYVNKGKCSYNGFQHYFPKGASKFFSQSLFTNLSISAEGVISATLNLKSNSIVQIAVKGLTTDQEWYIVNSPSASSNSSKYFWTLTNANINLNTDNGFVKGTLSSDASEAADGQFDFIINNKPNTNLQLINYTTGIKYSKSISTSIALGNAYRVKGPANFAVHTEPDANGWTAEKITITSL